MKYKDFYKDIIESSQEHWDSTKLINHILETRVQTFSGTLYHGTPSDGLLSMLTEGIWGTEHGEIADYSTFSTSVNENVLNLFSEHDKGTGIQFKVSNKRLIVLDDILSHLITRKSYSGIEFDFDEDEYEKFCMEYNIPRDNRDYYLPHNFLSSIKNIDGCVYDYVWNMLSGKHNRYTGSNDESEICFFGNGIPKLNKDIDSIYIDWDEYDISEKEDAIERLNSELSPN